MKGINAFSAMSGVDDRFVMASLLPADLPGGVHATAKVRKQEKDTWFSRMTSSGWFAAAVSLVVAFGVLGGIVAAGRMGTGTPSGTNPSHGMQGSQTYESTEGDIQTPLPEQKDTVRLTSNGTTVELPGYSVFYRSAELGEDGELHETNKDNGRIVDRLMDIRDELPHLRTGGNSFSLFLPQPMRLMDVQAHTYLETSDFSGYVQESLDVTKGVKALSALEEGEYIVIFEVFTEIRYSDVEYESRVDEYAVLLTVDRSLDESAPVRLSLPYNRHFYPEGYLLQETYFDAEQGKEVVKHYEGAEARLAQLTQTMLMATIYENDSISLVLAPHYDLRSVKVYRDLTLLEEAATTAPLEALPQREAGDYVIIITAVFNGTGATSVMEFPMRIELKEAVETTDPDSVTEPSDSPRVMVSSSANHLYYETTREAQLSWQERWQDGSLLWSEGANIMAQFPAVMEHSQRLAMTMGQTVTVTLGEETDTLSGVSVYDASGNTIYSGADVTALSELSAGTYFVVLSVITEENYMPDVQAYEQRFCHEYFFVLELHEAT